MNAGETSDASCISEVKIKDTTRRRMEGMGVKSGNDDETEFSFGVPITKNHSSLTELTERDKGSDWLT